MSSPPLSVQPANRMKATRLSSVTNTTPIAAPAVFSPAAGALCPALSEDLPERLLGVSARIHGQRNEPHERAELRAF